MIFTRQSWTIRREQVEMHQAALRGESFILARTRCKGLPTMELGGSGPPRDYVWGWLVLAGEAYLSLGGKEQVLRSGEMAFASDRNASFLSSSADLDLLQLYYAPRSRAERPRDARTSPSRIPSAVARLGAHELREVRRLASCLEEVTLRASIPDALAAVSRAIAMPSLDRDRVRELTLQASPEADRRVGATVSSLSTALASRPGIDDMANRLALPERRASEVASNYFRRYHANFDGWRSYLRALRIELALGVLSGRRVPAAELARWLGYSSSPAMYHALERRGIHMSAGQFTRGS